LGSRLLQLGISDVVFYPETILFRIDPAYSAFAQNMPEGPDQVNEFCQNHCV
jgi:hypothetical protein